jgi:hypothetical protein
MSNETTKPDTGAAEVAAVTVDPPAAPPPNIFTPDAQARRAALRAMSDEFPDEADRQPLTRDEVSLIRATPLAALEKAVVIAEAAPNIGAMFPNLEVVREAIAFELAYNAVRDDGRAFVRNIDLAILRKKKQPTKIARDIYRVAKSFITTDAGDPIRTHVADMKRLLRRPRRGKVTTPPNGSEETATKK